MSERSSVSRRVWRGALVALVAVTLGTTTAGATDTGASRPQQEAPAATSRPITSGTDRSAEAEAAPGDVAALAASNLSYNTIEPCRLFDTRQTGDGTIGDGRPVFGYDLGVQGACGLPADGSVKAVMVNAVANTTRGTGYARAVDYPLDPFSGPAVLHFNNGMVSSNAVPLSVCDTSTQTCTYDLTFIVEGGPTHIVFYLIGYFA
jgi:hypothetical protein